MKKKQKRKEYAKHGQCETKMISFRADKLNIKENGIK